MNLVVRAEDAGRRRGRHANGQHGRHPPTGLTPARRLARYVNRNAAGLAGFLAAGHFLLTLLTFMPQPHTGGDNAAYISLGRSLLEQQAYRSEWDPERPPHTQYPPVFPTMLAGGMVASLESFATLKFIISVMSACAVGFTFLWLRRRRRPALALSVGALLAVSPGVLELAHWVLSDVPFWAFTMIALWAFERLRPASRRRFAIAVLATVLAYFTRSAGLPLLLAAFGWLALHKHWRQLAILAGVALPLAFLWWLRAQLQGGVDYAGQFWFVNPYQPELGRIGVMDLADRMIENGCKYIRIHMPMLMTGQTGGVPLLIGLGIIGMALAGWVRRLRRPGLAELFLPLYVGLLLVWPAVWSGERFLLPALPVILYFAGDALVRMAQRLRRGSGFAFGSAAAGILLAAMVPAQVEAVSISGRCMTDYRAGERFPCLPPAWRDWFAVAEWGQTALPENAAVLSRKPTLFYVIARRPGTYYPMSAQPAELIGAAAEAGARYILLDHLDSLSQLYLVPAVLGRIQAFCLMYTSPLDGTAVLGILPGATGMRDSRVTDPAAVSLPPCGDEYWSAEGLRLRQAS